LILSLRRWLSDTMQAAVTVVICLTIIAVTCADVSLAIHARSAVSENWRGQYDILVTAPNQDFGASDTRGLVDPNFISTAGQGGISGDQVRRIAQLAGVEVAAPVGLVGTLRDVALSPSLVLNDDPIKGVSDLQEPVEVLRLTASLTDSTTGTEVSRSQGLSLVSRRSADNVKSLDSAPPAGGYPAGFAPSGNNLYYEVPLGALPQFPSNVIAVDPKAEAKLAGANGRFLSPLISLPRDRTTASADTWSKLVDSQRYLVQQTAIQQAGSNKDSHERVIPMVVNSSTSNSLNLQVVVEKAIGLDEAALAGSGATDELRRLSGSGTFEPVAKISKTASAVTVPFSTPNLTMLMPGSKLPDGESGGSFYSTQTGLSPELSGRPKYRISTAHSVNLHDPELTAVPQGVVNADGTKPSDNEKTTGRVPGVGDVQSYRAPISPARTDGGVALPAPIGEFATDDLRPASENPTSYVPSGIYDASTTTLGASGDGKSIRANYSGLDFLTAAPGAITDLAGGRSLRGADPIDAVRVRVSGVSEYSDVSQALISDIAGKITKLGLRATVVAGSSPGPVSLTVPDYISGDGSPPETIHAMQHWTTLGAAVRVSSAVAGMKLVLLLSTLACATFAFLVVVVARGKRHRTEVATLRTIGWNEQSIARSLVGRQLPTVASVLLVAACCFALGERGLLGAGVSAGLAVCAVFSSCLSVGIAMKSQQVGRGQRHGGRMVDSMASLALRHLRRAPGASLLQALGIGAVGMAAALTYLAIEHQKTASGNSLLSEYTFAVTSWPSLLLGASGVVAAVIIVILGRRAEISRRESERALFEIIGAPTSALRTLYAVDSAALGAVGIMFAGAAIASVVLVGGGSVVGIIIALVGSAAAALGTTLSKGPKWKTR